MKVYDAKIKGTVKYQTVTISMRTIQICFERSCVVFCCFLRGNHMNGYIKIADAAKKWGIGERRINTLCQEGRIEGATKFGNTWAIPDDAEKPKDERIKSGKYIKNDK